ncbi:hypothetical protein D3C72_1092950 [compost metagenome]
MHGGNRGLGGGGHHRAKVAGGHAVGEVAPAVALVGLDQRHVAVDGKFQHVVFAVDLACFFARSQFGTVRRGAEESANARTGSAQALGEVALGHQFQFELAAAVQLVEHVAVDLARKATDDLAHAARLEQRGQALVGIARVVVHHREVLGALGDEPVDQFTGDARRAKATYQHRGTILHPLQGLGHRVRQFVDHCNAFLV